MEFESKLMESTQYTPNTRKKRRNRFRYTITNQPLPLPVVLGTSTAAGRSKNLHEQCWLCYTGILKGGFVKVCSSGDMHDLYTMGCFGKGSFSRSRPTHKHKHPIVYAESQAAQSLKVIPQHMYIKHLNWQLKQTCNNYVEIPDICKGKVLENDHVSSKTITQSEDPESVDIQMDYHQDKLSTFGFVENRSFDIMKVESSTTIMNISTENSSLPGSSTMEVCENLDWDTMEADTNFWTSHTDVKSESERAVDFNYDSENEEDAVRCFSQAENNENIVFCDDKLQKNIKASEGDFHREKVLWDKNTNDENFLEMVDENITSKNENSDIEIKDKYIGFENTQICVSPINDSNVVSWQSNNDNNDDDYHLDPLCVENEHDGDLLVVPNVEDPTDEERGGWVPVIKKDPFRIEEYLVLSLEEALFLAYGLGCLVVKTQDETDLTISQMWQTFCKQKKNFIPFYVAYHHFRVKGWIPKCGLKFGAHFLLYKEGPEYHHATFAVLVEPVSKISLQSLHTTNYSSWLSLQALNRVSENVAKEILMCYVIIPDMKESTLLLPRCITQCSVQEVVIKRWIPSQERENPR